MKKEIPKAYEAKDVEEKWLNFWLSNNFFKANPHSLKKSYCICIPPPNVTGVLHMGHALVNTLQDILIRWKRMCGYETLWVPGTDHAGIATQTVVERNLINAYGKKRKDFSRDEFLSHVWAWKEKSQDQILTQLKRLGCSCDWSRLRFTMDEGNNVAVRTIFKKLFDQHLIYRGDYLVNWDPVTQTALADDEVEYEEKQSFLWYFKYPLKDAEGYALIATTRPETMLGDTAVAVSPKDARYLSLIGKKIILPFVNREIPIIADHHVDPEFGTGMVKVTPAHDPNDYQMGINHNLPLVNIMTPDGKINENGGKFIGQTMEEARESIVKEMRALGLLEKIEPHTHRVGVSYRSKAKIEPYISKQWFVRMSGFAEKMRSAVADEKIKIIPEHWKNTYFHWINNLRDWCISRQLWWGHRIPVWYNKKNPEKMICYAMDDLPPEVKADPESWIQDEDVLDTWFSSALWPFAALGWPINTLELEKFYPNSTLITGHDILFFWVARMIMMGEYAMGKIPFPETFLHGLIYGKSYWRSRPEGGITYVSEEERREYDLGKPVGKDVQFCWEKMSKSKGNIIDPIEIINDYGTDAMRMALCSSASQSREIDLDRRKFEEFRNFANKIWNGARFVFMNLEGDKNQNASELRPEEFGEGLDETWLFLEDRWILSRLTRTVQEVNTHLNNYLFDQAAMEAYNFFWKEFCSYYLEIAKPILFGKKGSPIERKNKQKILLIVLTQAVRLIHPMAPFITEELFQIIREQFSTSPIMEKADDYTKECIKALQATGCIVAPYPQVLREYDINIDIENTFSFIDRIVYAIRNIRGEMKIPPGTNTEVYIVGSANDSNYNSAINHQNIISALTKTESIEFFTQLKVDGFVSTGVVETLNIQIPLPMQMIIQEKNRLLKEQEKLLTNIEKINSQLNNKEFISNAPKHLVDKQKEQRNKAQTELKLIQEKLDQITHHE